MSAANRKYIRHPTEIPIEVALEPGVAGDVLPLQDVSLGGICFRSATALEIDCRVHVRINHLRLPFDVPAVVRWCTHMGENYLVGVEFLDVADALRARMVEQVCYIEKYRQDVWEKEKRRLSSYEAAQEWIQKFASQFPLQDAGEEPGISKG